MAMSVLKNKRERGFLDGQFLIAMPGMADANFTRTVVYICAHSEDGAMGFVINRPQQLNFSDVLLHLDLVGEGDRIASQHGPRRRRAHRLVEWFRDHLAGRGRGCRAVLPCSKRPGARRRARGGRR